MMEPVQRVFAQEFNASTCSAAADNMNNVRYVVTPGGAWCTRMFIVGALTGVRGAAGDLMRARVADPTGTFDLAITRREQSVAETLGYVTLPAFVAVTGTARLYASGSRTYASITPESLNVVDRTTRDAWVIRTAEITLNRLEVVCDVLHGIASDERIETAVRHYGTTDSNLRDLTLMLRTALGTVPEVVGGGEITPVSAQGVMLEVIRDHGGQEGAALDDVVRAGVGRGLSAPDASDAVEALLAGGVCYSPRPGMIREV